MTGTDLLALLPPAFQAANAENGHVLAAIAQALAVPYRRLEENIDALYDDWFVETCSVSAIALIGASVGVEPRADFASLIPSWRRYVADAAALRRRKGTLATLSAAATAASGWPALAVFDRDRTQAIAAFGQDGDPRIHVDDERPFDETARVLDVADDGPHADGVTLYLWRLRVHPVTHGEALALGGGRFLLDPLGIDRPMFHLPRTRENAVAMPGRVDLPVPLSRDMLDRSLALADDEDDRSDCTVFVGGAPVRPERMLVADLGAWAVDWPNGKRLAIDPERGRILLRSDRPAAKVTANRYQATAGDIGGGAYRQPAPGHPEHGFHRTGHGLGAKTIEAALACWRETGATTTIEIDDSMIHAGDVVLSGAAGGTLVLRAREGEMPCIAGDIMIGGTNGPVAVMLDGLLVRGGVEVTGAVDLSIVDCTIRPESGSSPALRRGSGTGATVMERSIVAGVDDRAPAGRTSARDCLFDRSVVVAGTLEVERSTFLSPVRAGALEAADAIFAASIEGGGDAARVRHSYRASAEEVDEDGRPITPTFVSRRYGHPGFGQLAPATSRTIREGASNGFEMGCFNAAATPLRLAALNQAVVDHAPWRWSVRPVFVT